MASSSEMIGLIEDACGVLHGRDDDFEPLMEGIGDARLVLIGEASHGTHEFYETRARITRQLIEEKGFGAVIVEADWPDAYRVNRYVRGTNDDANADRALSGFRRFPQWMWRNRDVLEFVQWLRRHNDGLPPRGRTPKCGFYGMDLYSLYTSIESVLEYLERADPQAAQRARFRYGCFEQFEEDPQAYGYAAALDLGESCREEVVAQLVEMRRHAAELAKRDGQVAEDEAFYAEQNARLAQNAEAYYREMFAGHVDTWNLRDSHMVETIEALLAHLDRTPGTRTKAVVWAHNSHLGDARATEMSRRGELNVGQLCRQRWGAGRVFSVGFTTHTGSVAAATNWGSEVEFKQVRPSLAGSYERLFHDVGFSNFMLIFGGAAPEVARALEEERLERAIGVIYRPETERLSHYFKASLPRQFDAVIHVDVTSPVWPLEAKAPFDAEKAETYPTGV
jgi:erythromycin esterase-like protein